ncbi:MAG: ribonuclease E/G, partial [Mycobacterium sp.]
MAEDAPSSDISTAPAQHEELPDRLRVHSLARALGTTSKQVLDALTELDGRVRSAHSSVDRVEAVRVRDLLGPTDLTRAELAAGTDEPDEPESRLMLEPTVDQAEYMPLFVAPQSIRSEIDDIDDTDYSADDGGSDTDDENGERPANRRRRRGRRGRGRGRGSEDRTETGGDSGDGETGDDSTDAADTDEDEEAEDAEDAGSAEEAAGR